MPPHGGYLIPAYSPIRTPIEGGDRVPDPTITEYKIAQLFEGLQELKNEVRGGFADLRRVLDDRLQSRDDRIAELEERMGNAERALARQTVINAILSAVGGAALALVVRVLTT